MGDEMEERGLPPGVTVVEFINTPAPDSQSAPLVASLASLGALERNVIVLCGAPANPEGSHFVAGDERLLFPGPVLFSGLPPRGFLGRLERAGATPAAWGEFAPPGATTLQTLDQVLAWWAPLSHGVPGADRHPIQSRAPAPPLVIAATGRAQAAAAVPLALRRIAALGAAGYAIRSTPLRLSLMGATSATGLMDLARRLACEGPVELVFDADLDLLVESGPTLLSAIEFLAAAGHRLELGRLFHRPLTVSPASHRPGVAGDAQAHVLLAALRLVSALAEEYSETFGWRAHGQLWPDATHGPKERDEADLALALLRLMGMESLSSMGGPQTATEGETVSYRVAAERFEARGYEPGQERARHTPPTDPRIAREVSDPVHPSADWLGFIADVKPVCRLEALPPERAEALATQITTRWPEAFVTRGRVSAHLVDLVVARQPELAEQLATMKPMRGTGVAVDERARIERTGRLLGYPPCCAARFAANAAGGRETDNEWLHLENRVWEPGSVPLALRPLVGPLSFVPCSACCPRALEQAATLAAKGIPTVAPDAAWPLLIMLDRPGWFAQLEPLSPVGERFHFRVARVQGDDQRLAKLAEADRLEVLPGRIRGLRGAEVVAGFTLEAFLWWHQRPFHVAFWRHVLWARACRPAKRTIEEAAPVERTAPRVRPRILPLDQALGLLHSGINTGALSCARVAPTADGKLLLIDLALAGSPAGSFCWLPRGARRGEPRLFGDALIPSGPKAACLQRDETSRLAGLLAAELGPLWRRSLGRRLERSNRELVSVAPREGLGSLLRDRLVQGMRCWGRYVLELFEEWLGPDGLPRVRFVLAGNRHRIELRFGPHREAPASRTLLTTTLGALWLAHDERPQELLARGSERPELAVAFELARAVPRTARFEHSVVGQKRPTIS